MIHRGRPYRHSGRSLAGGRGTPGRPACEGFHVGITWEFRPSCPGRKRRDSCRETETMTDVTGAVHGRRLAGAGPAVGLGEVFNHRYMGVPTRLDTLATDIERDWKRPGPAAISRPCPDPRATCRRGDWPAARPAAITRNPTLDKVKILLTDRILDCLRLPEIQACVKPRIPPEKNNFSRFSGLVGAGIPGDTG